VTAKRTPGAEPSKEGAQRLTPRYRPRQAEKTPPCQEACPNCGDIRGWINTVAQREKSGLALEEAYAQAWRTIVERNPFPSVLGRICPHPCEAGCNRGGHDEALAINAMERFLGDWAIEQGIPLPRLEEPPREEWIGVVGAGPSGLSFAYQMARRGYRVTIYESRSRAGGMLRHGVPDYRLPPATLEAEIERIVALGVELLLGTVVGRDVTLAELRERHAAVYLGLGAQTGRSLGIPGEEGPGVWRGIEYLQRANEGGEVDLGEKVIVIGGGNSAIDAARTARRSGAAVSLLYRRSREEMPASVHEVREAEEEGVELLLLAAPVRIERADDGRVTGLIARRMALGAPDDSGRRRPEPVPGSEFLLATDAVIAAVSQAPELSGFESVDHSGVWLAAGDRGLLGDRLLAGGDALGLGIAGNAIVQGRWAAEALHAHLRGQAPPAPEAPQANIPAERIRFDQKPGSRAAQARKMDGAARVLHKDAEVVATITESQFLAEVERCYSCGLCFGCEQCEMYCTVGCFTRLEEVAPGRYFALSLEACEECGKCVEVCPCGFLDVVDGG